MRAITESVGASDATHNASCLDTRAATQDFTETATYLVARIATHAVVHTATFAATCDVVRNATYAVSRAISKLDLPDREE